MTSIENDSGIDAVIFLVEMLFDIHCFLHVLACLPACLAHACPSGAKTRLLLILKLLHPKAMQSERRACSALRVVLEA
eukprot:2058020-Amphidinium_carterae.1